jgi:hypothetical protein
MSQTTTVMTAQQHVPFKPRPKIFDSWSFLTCAEQDSCIGPCELESLRGTYNWAHVWAPSGCLLHRWDDFISSYLLDICVAEAEGGNRLGFRQRRFATLQFLLLMVNESATRTEAVPAVIVAHRRLRVARRAVSVLSNHPVVREYGFRFEAFEDRWYPSMQRLADLQYSSPGAAHQNDRHKRWRTGCRACEDRRLCCDEAEPECHNCVKSGLPCPGYPQRRFNITGPTDFSFRLMPRTILIRQGNVIHRTASAGGYLQVGAYTYLLTAAHPFLLTDPTPQTDLSGSLTRSNSSLSYTDSDEGSDTDEVKWLRDCQIDIMAASAESTGASPVESLIFTPPLEEACWGDRFLSSIEQDWMLIRYDSAGQSNAEDSEDVVLVPAPVILPSSKTPCVFFGTSEHRACNFSGLGATVGLQWTAGALNTWMLDLPTRMGDSGAWIADITTRTLYGMVIGYGSLLGQTYVVPARLISEALISFSCAQDARIDGLVASPMSSRGLEWRPSRGFTMQTDFSRLSHLSDFLKPFDAGQSAAESSPFAPWADMFSDSMAAQTLHTHDGSANTKPWSTEVEMDVQLDRDADYSSGVDQHGQYRRKIVQDYWDRPHDPPVTTPPIQEADVVTPARNFEPPLVQGYLSDSPDLSDLSMLGEIFTESTDANNVALKLPAEMPATASSATASKNQEHKHWNERPHRCKVAHCSANHDEFQSNDELVAHIFKAHPRLYRVTMASSRLESGRSEVRWSCTVSGCGRQYARQDALGRHIRSVHGLSFVGTAGVSWPEEGVVSGSSATDPMLQWSRSVVFEDQDDYRLS